MLLLVSSLTGLSGEMKTYVRIGDLSETAEIYLVLGGDDYVYVDANSVPKAYRSRFKNEDAFRKIDMKEVKEAKKVEENGLTTYKNAAYAKNDSNLYKVGNNQCFIDLNTVPDDMKDKIAKSSKFTHIGTCSGNRQDGIVNMINKMLEAGNEVASTVSADSTTASTETTGNLVVDSKLKEYNNAVDKALDKVLLAFDSELKRLQSKGDLNGHTTLNKIKTDFSEDDSSLKEDLIKDFYSIKSAFKDYGAVKAKEGEKLNKVIDAEIANETKKGNIEGAKGLSEMKGKYESIVGEQIATKGVKNNNGLTVSVNDKPEIWKNDVDLTIDDKKTPFEIYGYVVSPLKKAKISIRSSMPYGSERLKIFINDKALNFENENNHRFVSFSIDKNIFKIHLKNSIAQNSWNFGRLEWKINDGKWVEIPSNCLRF
jgi:hypothetical protein